MLHATDTSPIVASRRNELAAAGLTYVDAPPKDKLDSVAQSMPVAWGKPQFAKVSWAGGDAWVVGFEHHQCMIDATDSNGPALVKALRDLFESPGVPWRKLPAGDAPDRYGMAITPPGGPTINLVANMVGMDLPPAGREQVVTFEIAPTTGTH